MGQDVMFLGLVRGGWEESGAWSWQEVCIPGRRRGKCGSPGPHVSSQHELPP